MDTFVEQIVKKKKTVPDYIIIAAVAAAALLLTALIFLFIRVLLPVTVLIWWGAWWLITGRSKEFEYSVTNGEMDIDCIVARRRRKRVCSVTCAKVDAYGPLSPDRLTGRKFDRTIMAAPSMNENGNYYFTYRSKTYGSTLVIFSPDERVNKAFFAALPRLMQIQLEKENRT